MDRQANINRSTGQQAEDAALDYLLDQGLTLLQRNYRCKGGEIDLVMKEGQTLVFVEVKHRSSERFGSPMEAIGRSKQRRLIVAAKYYLQAHKQCRQLMCRFDVVTSSRKAGGSADIIWLPNAFVTG